MTKEFTKRKNPKFTKRENDFGNFWYYQTKLKKRNTERCKKYREKKKTLENKGKVIHN